MRLLPSEKEEKLQEAINDFEKSGSLSIYEPCNCGSQIRHNNGGNYHECIYLFRDKDEIYVKYDTTCELVPEAEWEPCNDWKSVITQYADWL